jgi:hypothetical protein
MAANQDMKYERESRLVLGHSRFARTRFEGKDEYLYDRGSLEG